MLNYTSQYQTQFEEFSDFSKINLNPSNRWIKMAHVLPWDNMVAIYAKKLSPNGAGGINPRHIIGAFIIKHKLNLSDEETLLSISENPYMQYFIGLDVFSPDPPFAPTLFVELRKKLGSDSFDKFSEVLMKICLSDKISENSMGKEIKNKGKLKLDATVADQYITYPNDLGLLNHAREITERIIDKLFKVMKPANLITVKPRTYRKVARGKYLIESKKKNKSLKTIRPCIRYHLNCLDRNIKSIFSMLDTIESTTIIENGISYKEMRQLWIIQVVNEQQRGMYNAKTNRCDDRIVSIDQPHVRPIKRGKQGRKVEFGSKLGIAVMDGFTKVGTLSWNAYNEASDLIPHVQAYKELYGYYPDLVQVDKIYGTHENRNWCKTRKIRMTVTDIGPSKKLSPYQKHKKRKEYSERNAVEGKIGQLKQGYALNKIKAKRKTTSECWIGAVVFIANLVRFAEFHGLSFEETLLKNNQYNIISTGILTILSHVIFISDSSPMIFLPFGEINK